MKQEIKKSEVAKKADSLIMKIMIGYLIFGVFLSFFYDTWLIGILGGILSFSLFLTAKYLFPGRNVHHYVAGLSFGLFMAQFIYQMHGMFEMHFAAFIALIILLSYQNYKVLIPLVLLVVVHHASFAYIQYYGFVNNLDKYTNIYFTQLDYMDLTTFLFHAGLFAVAALFAGMQAYHVEQLSKKQLQSLERLEKDNQKNQRNISFANEIAKGNFDYEYKLHENDDLGKSLVEMRDNLLESTQREKREKFIAQGKAKVGEILRENINDLEALADNIISYLVNYAGLNQGALFIASDDDDEAEKKILRLKGCYAYGRKKFINKELLWGQGMVGQCAIEQAPIYMTKVPESYVKITSGLGDAKPRSIFLIPIANDDKVVGVLEFASFKVLEDYQMDFLKQVGVDIASSIVNLQTNQKMQVLYHESQRSTEELRSQEEEMRQNMEELSATQEEMKRYSLETEEKLKALDNSNIALLEVNGNGIITSANRAAALLLNYPSAEELFEKSYSTISSGGSVDLQNIHNVSNAEEWKDSHGKTINVKASYSAIQFANGKAEKIIILGFKLEDSKVSDNQINS